MLMKTLENSRLYHTLFGFNICCLAFMCNVVCDMETSIISFLICFDFEFNEDNSKLNRSTERADLLGQGRLLTPYCLQSRSTNFSSSLTICIKRFNFMAA